MKVILLLLSLIGKTLTSNPGCQFCVQGLSTMYEDWVSSEFIIPQQIEVLQAKVCPTYEDPSYCIDYLEEVWEIVANLLWTQGNAEFVCQTMDPTCSTLRTWDCETCIQDILDMNNAMTSEAVATEFSNLLAGISLGGKKITFGNVILISPCTIVISFSKF